MPEISLAASIHCRSCAVSGTDEVMRKSSFARVNSRCNAMVLIRASEATV